MSLRIKLALALALIASLAIGLASYGALAVNATGDLVVRLFDEPLIGVSYARAASATLHEARALMDRSLLLGAGETSGVADSLRRMHEDIREDLGIVRRRMRGAVVVTALHHAETSIDDWFDSSEMVLSPPPEGLTSLPMPAAIARQGAQAGGLLNEVVEQVAAEGYAYRSRAKAEMRRSSSALAAMALGIVALSVAVALLFGNMLIRPIRAAIRIAEQVAAGKSTTVIGTARRDEIGRLLTCLGTMQEKLRSRAAQATALMEEKDRTADALQEKNLQFDSALSNMSHGLLMCDGGARVVVSNRRFCDIYGIDPDTLRPGCSFLDVLALSMAAGNHPGCTADDVVAEANPLINGQRRGAAIRTIAGGRTVAVSHEPMPDGGWISMHEDITERRKSEAEIAFLAWHDPLTRIPNRMMFHDRLEQALAKAGRGTGFAVLSLDLDDFKFVNDAHGHSIGDSLLRAVAHRLQDVVREIDSVARLGGDEFAILQLDVGAPADVTTLAHRVIQAVAEPFDIEGTQIVIGVSIGIALAPSDGAYPAQLLKNAGLALYRAKQDGRGTWRFFEPTMDAMVRARRTLEADLRAPTLQQQLELHYQPVVNTRTRLVTGFEALLRWRHPTRGMVPPGAFIGVAEEIGMIVPIGVWALNEACATAATWPDRLSIAVNLSPMQFRGRGLIETVDHALRSSGLAPERLRLEITESVLLESDSETLSVLHALRELGAGIAMDDFGTGYSSLSYLRSFPFDTIKIDQSFVRELEGDDEGVAIIRAVTSMSSSLRMTTIAEGVETEEQFAILAAEGCDEIQGYLFSKPVPASAVPALIARLSRHEPVATHGVLIAASGP